jgi:hypothetical protein
MTTPNTAIGGLDRFGVFVHGATPEQAREIGRLGYGAIWVGGADHVAIQVLGETDKLLPTLSELAGPLGLSR